MTELERLFKDLDVTRTVTGVDIKKLVRMHHRVIPKDVRRSYVTANGSKIHLIFDEDKCTAQFWFRKWRYCSITFCYK